MVVRRSTLAGLTGVIPLLFSGWSPEYLWGSLGYDLESVAVMSSKYALLLAVLGGCLAWARLGRPARLWAGALYSVYLLASATRVGGVGPKIAVFTSAIVLAYLLYRELGETPGARAWLHRGVCLAVALNLLLTALLMLRRESVIAYFEEGVPRFSSVLGHSPTGLFYLAVTVHLLFVHLERRGVSLLVGAVAASLVSLASQTRVSAFALAVTWMLWGLFSTKRRGLGLVMGALSLGVLTAILVSHERLDPRMSLSSGTYVGRVVIWRWGLDVFRSSPLLGRGVGYTDEYLGDSVRTGAGAIHNEYIRVLAEQGVLGVLALACFLWLGVRVVLRSWSMLGLEIRFLFLATLSCVLLAAWSDNLVHLYYSFAMVMMMFMARCLTACAAARRAEEARVQFPPSRAVEAVRG